MLSPSAAEWRQLTSQPVKRAVYADEPCTGQGWQSATEALGDRAAWTLQRSALTVFRPDALFAQRVAAGLAYIAQLGLEPVFAAEVGFTGRTAALMWQHQWGGASPDRTALMTTLLSSGPSLLVAFRERAQTIELPAPVRLSAVKGSGHPAERRGDELRSALHSPNRVLTFVHVADEPADILRETAILLPAEQRRALFSALGAGTRTAPLPPPPAAEAPDLDGRRALTRIIARLEQAAPLRGEDAERARVQLLTTLAQILDGRRLAWGPFRDAVARSGVALPLWDQLLAGAAHIPYDSTDGTSVIPDSGRRGWLAGHGTVLSAPGSGSLRQREASR
ncbi:hypothetical protein SLNWT_0532 [Streptomyces albus]|uniref:Nucleoside diphosphate kinase-like domain-containing protein n=1 Tax=Streptomyces albus (strain ATCC 21838 / DSM 41398 / FERM P-419 / JCM 4703 / NBRC 107858) TaxID=1081613 RepID=A0A0B5EFW5_STRA4|nr:hypothetical protein SLNWT_0532 [Streptomyces albus]AOU75221.1 hypothetical protein SLNHY_0530 [Streptomyces albus]AYN31026.1 hypothetical protein DUI70_0523 [Streptomyces albus]